MILSSFHTLYQEDLEYILSVKGIDEICGKTFLITGSTGLIGACLVDALMLYNERGAGIRVFACGRSREKAEERFCRYFDSELFNFIEQDACSPFSGNVVADYIIPLASNTHPLAYAEYPVETMMINIYGTKHALDLADRCNATVLYPSSVEIYGDSNGGESMNESFTGKLDLSKPRACYTESKRSAEALCQSYASERGVKVKIVRLSRVFGPTMLMTDSKASSQFIKRALHHEDIVLKSTGEQLFSYTYVADAVSAMLHVLIHGAYNSAYNIASSKCDMRLKDFAQCCAKYACRRVVFDLPSDAEAKGYSIAQNAVMDGSALEQIGWTGKYDCNEAITRTLNILNQ